MAVLTLSGCAARWPIGLMLATDGPRMIWACGVPITGIAVHDEDANLLWRVTAAIPEPVEEVSLGRVPAGFSETHPLSTRLPEDRPVFITVDFLRLSYDPPKPTQTMETFQIDELEPGTVTSSLFRGDTLDEFITWSADVCGH